MWRKGLNEIIERYVNTNILINIPENVEVSDYKCSLQTSKIFDLLKDNLKLRKNNMYRVYTWYLILRIFWYMRKT